MSLNDALMVVSTALISVGGAGAIVFGLSSWLGKVWANRLMEADRAQHARELERIRSELHRETEEQLREAQNQLDILKEKHLKGFSDKVQIYRLVVDVLSDVLGDFDRMKSAEFDLSESIDNWDGFNRSRMKTWGYLAMLAPQPVMDAFDNMLDLLINITTGSKSYDWPEVRQLIIALINEIRKDIAIDSQPIEYRGEL